MYIIVGLGNPTLKYQKTRHNVGFDTIDLISKKHKIKFKNKFNALCGEGIINGEKVLLVKPLTYMNNSGDAVVQIVNYYKADPTKELIVISDDLSLDVGTIRIRQKGSAGGHNGLKSIINRIETSDFARIRIGIGKVDDGQDIIGHVLGRFSREDRKKVKITFEKAVEALECILDKDFENAMSRFNGKCV